MEQNILKPHLNALQFRSAPKLCHCVYVPLHFVKKTNEQLTVRPVQAAPTVLRLLDFVSGTVYDQFQKLRLMPAACKFDDGSLAMWVFGYGSLMWRPGFSYIRSAPARLHGAHRALCVHSVFHRGTPEMPGLVLGLDQGGECWGRAFQVDAGQQEQTIAYLREREQITKVYHEHWWRITLTEGEQVKALTYIVDREHAQYSGKLPREEQLRIIARARGHSGVNSEYIHNTVAHMRELGIDDPHLFWLAEKLSQHKLNTSPTIAEIS